MSFYEWVGVTVVGAAAGYGVFFAAFALVKRIAARGNQPPKR